MQKTRMCILWRCKAVPPPPPPHYVVVAVNKRDLIHGMKLKSKIAAEELIKWMRSSAYLWQIQNNLKHGDPVTWIENQGPRYLKQEAQLMLTNLREVFIGQSRSPNIVPFHVH